MGNSRTNYDKDCENFKLLTVLAGLFPDTAGHLKRMESQFDFSVNVIEEGIINHGLVKIAAWREVVRRVERYNKECAAGDERLSTLQQASHVAGKCAVHLCIKDENSSD